MIPEIDAGEIIRRLRYYAPQGDQARTYETIRQLTIDYATNVGRLLPASREKSQWMTTVEDSQMWANKAVAVNGAHAG